MTVRCALLGLALSVACSRPAPLPRFGALPNFTLQNQAARTVTTHDLLGKVLVVDFIFTNCPDVCPLLTEQLGALRKQLPQNAPIRLVSFSVDPEHDTPVRLTQFAAQHGAQSSDWWFLTGPLDEIKRVVVHGFKEAMEAQPAAAGRLPNVLHGTHFVLVDPAGQIRGYFRSDDDGRRELAAAVSTLLSEGKT